MSGTWPVTPVHLAQKVQPLPVLDRRWPCGQNAILLCPPVVSEVCMTKLLWAAAMANSCVLWGEGCSVSPASQLCSRWGAPASLPLWDDVVHRACEVVAPLATVP